MDAFSEGNEHGLVLYDFPGSPCARRCRISLVEKGLRWDTETIDLSRLEQRNPAYLEINPNGFVPTLAHGERVIYESNVITEYLDDAFPERPLYPTDPWERAQVRMWQAAELAMAKDFRTLMYQRVLGPIVRLTRSLEQALAAARRSTDDPADLAWEERVWRLQVLNPAEEAEHVDRLWKWLEVLEARLRARTFLVGERFTQAEISVFPRVMMYAHLGLPITRERAPNVRRWMDRLQARPSFARTLSPMDRGLTQLSRTPLLPWLGRTLGKPAAQRSVAERLGLIAARQVFVRVLGGASERRAAAPASARPIRRPHTGRIPPPEAMRRSDAPARPPDAASDLLLYDDVDSPHARRVRILLLEKGLRWRSVAVDLGRMEHKSPAFLAVNPHGELPALRHGDRVLCDSRVIAEYLDDTFCTTGPRLHPPEAWAAARVRMWLALEAGTHKEFRPLFYLHVIRPRLQDIAVGPDPLERILPAGVHPSHRRWLADTLEGRPRFDTSEEMARHIILSKLDVLEQRLAERPFLVGDGLTLADLAWWTRLDLLPRLGVRLERARHPALARWHARLAERPSFAASAMPAEAEPLYASAG